MANHTRIVLFVQDTIAKCKEEKEKHAHLADESLKLAQVPSPKPKLSFKSEF